MKTTVLVSIPNTGWIHKLVVISVLRMMQDTNNCAVNFIFPTHIPYENNLHIILVDFLKGNYDFWINIDADNPPFKNPLELVHYDLPIIGLPTPVFHHTGKEGPGERPVYWNAYKAVGDAYTEWPIKEGLQEVDAIGTGCFVLSKEVFEKEEMRKGPFLRKVLVSGVVEKGNDISFCERAKANGIKIYAHYDYPCRHFVELELTEVEGAYRNLFAPEVGKWPLREHPG
jgi:hypothetical protein